MLNELKQLNMTMISTLPVTTITTLDLGKSLKQTHFFVKTGQQAIMLWGGTIYCSLDPPTIIR